MEVRRIPNSELYHHGIKGQKWGVRRYQNPDGSLTAAGQARYTYNERKKSLSNVSNMSSKDMQDAINRMNLEKQYRKTTKENLKDSRADSHSKLKTAAKVVAGTALAAGAGYVGYKAIKTGKALKKSSVNLRSLTDEQLLSKIKRLELERDFANLSNAQLNKGKSTLNNILETAGTAVLASAVTGGMAYALRVAITGESDPETMANYIAKNPGAKKK